MRSPVQVLDRESVEGGGSVVDAGAGGVDGDEGLWSAAPSTFWDARVVHLRGVDVVIVTACALAALVLAGPARWAPGAPRAAVAFALFALGPLVLRTLEASFPRRRLLGFAASFWLLPVLALSHEFLAPLVNALTPVLKDAPLAALELRLLGTRASVVLGRGCRPGSPSC